MKAVLCVAVQLVLCIGAMAFVDLHGCKRSHTEVDVHKAKDVPDLRQQIKEHLQFDLEDSDIIAGFFVHGKDFDEVGNVFFAGRQKDKKAVTFMSSEDGQNAQMHRIPYSKYYLYLECEVQADEEDTES